jgi:hypothetical protein
MMLRSTRSAALVAAAIATIVLPRSGAAKPASSKQKEGSAARARLLGELKSKPGAGIGIGIAGSSGVCKYGVCASLRFDDDSDSVSIAALRKRLGELHGVFDACLGDRGSLTVAFSIRNGRARALTKRSHVVSARAQRCVERAVRMARHRSITKVIGTIAISRSYGWGMGARTGTKPTGKRGYGYGAVDTGGRNRKPRPAWLGVGRVRSRGALNKAVIRRHLRRKTAAMRNCAERFRPTKDSLSVGASFEVLGDGRVTNLRLVRVQNPKLVGCLARQLRQVRYPRKPSNTKVELGLTVRAADRP